MGQDGSVGQAESRQRPWASGGDSVRVGGVRACSIGVGGGLPCECGLREELGKGVLRVGSGPGILRTSEGLLWAVTARGSGAASADPC